MNIRGFYTALARETYRFIFLFRQTVLPPLITTLLFILIFGYSLGSSIKEINGHPYIVYILPGLAQLGIITNSFSNSSFSLYMSRLEKSVENILIAPLNFFQITLAFIIGGVLRGLTVGFATLFMAAFFVDFPLPHPILLISSWILTSLFFSSLGVIIGILSETWDHLAAVSNFVITPLIYLGGTFYSVKMLPPFWQKVSYFNPIFYCIDLTRFTILGQSDTNWVYSFVFISFLSIITLTASTTLIKKGYKLIS